MCPLLSISARTARSPPRPVSLTGRGDTDEDAEDDTRDGAQGGGDEGDRDSAGGILACEQRTLGGEVPCDACTRHSGP
jgi:hypothetical protein